MVRKLRTISFSEKKRWSARDWRKLERGGEEGGRRGGGEEGGRRGGGRRGGGRGEKGNKGEKLRGKEGGERSWRRESAQVESHLHFHCHAW